MTSNVLILSNARSLNKTKLHIKSLTKIGVTPVVFTDIDQDSLNVSEHFYQEALYTFVNFTNASMILQHAATYSPVAICSVSENLLELVPDLEERCGLPPSISHMGAKILSDKFLFDQFCFENNLPVAKSILPKSESEILTFGKNCILKPTVGSGQYYNFRDKLTDDHFEYRYFENGKNLASYLNKIGKLNFIINANVDGRYCPERYSQKPVKFMLQEYFEPKKELCCIGNFVNGELTINSTGQLYKSGELGDAHHQLIDIDKVGREQHCTEHQLYIMGPPTHAKLFETFLKKISDRLQIKNLFFSGPDLFEISGSDFIFSDFNGRISGQFNEIPDDMALQVVIDFWERCLQLKNKDKKTDFKEYFATGFPYLKSGRYTYDETHPDIKFTKSVFTIQEKRKSMDNKLNTTKMILRSKNQENVIALFDKLPKLLSAEKLP